jgi:3-hydroxyisobutyrate dehydrogenase-like beta-hydroxyacid dehydrogenase
MSDVSEPIQTGVIGLGKMGSAISDRLIASGRAVLGWDSSEAVRAAFAARGGTLAANLAEMGRASVVLSVVWDDNATREVALGPGGLVDTLPRSATHLAMGTISPALSRLLNASHQANGQRYLAATMFGRPEAAAAGTVLVVCSGARETYVAINSVFDCMGTSRWIGDDPAQANLMKLMGNNMIFVAIELLGEMFVLLRKAGVSEQNARELLVERLFPGPIFSGYAQRVIDRQWSPPAGTIAALAHKDNNLCIEAAQSLGVELPLVNLMRDQIDEAIRSGAGDLDISAFARGRFAKAGFSDL